MTELKLAWDDKEEKEASEELWSLLQKCDLWDDLQTLSTHDRIYLNHLIQCAIRPIETDMKNNLARNAKTGYERARFIDRMISHIEQLAINKLNKLGGIGIVQRDAAEYKIGELILELGATHLKLEKAEARIKELETEVAGYLEA